MSTSQILSYLNTHKDPVRAKNLSRFFKTGPGQYGEGDQFIGLTVPIIRAGVKKYWQGLTLSDITSLISSEYHEIRLAGLLVLVKQYVKGEAEDKNEIYDFYLAHLDSINNWDLVDLTAPNIVGDYLLTRPRQILYKLAKFKDLWHRRVAILATFTFVRESDFVDSLKLAELLLHDPHDLLHKAVGWMLREIGKRDLPTLITFLDTHALDMPRTMLRYAIEKLSPSQRHHYMMLK